VAQNISATNIGCKQVTSTKTTKACLPVLWVDEYILAAVRGIVQNLQVDLSWDYLSSANQLYVGSVSPSRIFDAAKGEE
jgi:hypothetical protein